MTRSEIQRRYRENNRDKVNEIARIWREKNRDKIKRDRRAYRQKVYNEQKEKIITHKTTKGCFKCGIKLACVLEFHHVNPFEKERQISDMVGKGSWLKLEKEMAKCEVVCRNCHSIIHDKELGEDLLV